MNYEEIKERCAIEIMANLSKFGPMNSETLKVSASLACDASEALVAEMIKRDAKCGAEETYAKMQAKYWEPSE